MPPITISQTSSSPRSTFPTFAKTSDQCVVGHCVGCNLLPFLVFPQVHGVSHLALVNGRRHENTVAVKVQIATKFAHFNLRFFQFVKHLLSVAGQKQPVEDVCIRRRKLQSFTIISEDIPEGGHPSISPLHLADGFDQQIGGGHRRGDPAAVQPPHDFQGGVDLPRAQASSDEQVEDERRRVSGGVRPGEAPEKGRRRRRAEGGGDEGLGGGAEAGAGEGVNGCRVGEGVVATEVVLLRPEEEAKGEAGAVAEAEDDAGGLGGGEPGGVDGAEVVPSAPAPESGENRHCR